jgi:hypothetical protein
MFNQMLQKIRPLARSIKYGRLLKRAAKDSVKDAEELSPPVAFVIGCGRSGTTIMGKLLAAHPEVLYLFEPYHIWKVICPQTDMIQLYTKDGSETHCILGNEQIGTLETKRFNACMQSELKRSGAKHKRVIEKTPINAMRIPLLKKISPNSPFLHVVRDGIDVVRSIDRLASSNSYQLSGKGDWNQWWGKNHCKWTSLITDAKNNLWFADEVDQLTTNVEVGALEWLVSLSEVNAHRNSLGNALLEVHYDKLTHNPNEQLTTICSHFGIKPEDLWLEESTKKLDSERKNKGNPVVLPPKMCAAFNAFQDQYGFEGRAITA